MATLTTKVITRLGVDSGGAASAAGGGDAMAVGDNMFLQVTNGGGSPITVTLVVPAARQHDSNLAITSSVVSVPAGQAKYIGKVSSVYADPTTGLCTITYSGVTTVSVTAIQLAA